MKLSKKHKEWIPCYSYKIHWSDEDQVYVVAVEEFDSCMTHGSTPEEALRMGHEAVELVMETLLSKKKQIPEPISKIKASGEFIVRTEPSLHKRLIEKAHAAGFKTLNKFIVAKLSEI